MAWFKRRYQRFCYECSWRYPRLSRFVVRVKFPVQVCILCLALFAFVSFYQTHYSFEASMRAHQAQLAAFEIREKSASIDSAVLQTSTVAVYSEPAPALFAIPKEVDQANFNSMKSTELAQDANRIQLKNQILAAERSLRQQVQKAEQELKIKTQETEILKAKIAKANALLKEEADLTEQLKTTTLTNNQKRHELLLLNGRWISKQRTDSYIIQLASSTRDADLIEYARSLSSHGPLAIYPFKKTKDGKLLYGLSAGLFGSSTEASKAAAQLPVESAQSESWIRKVADVSSQIATFQ